MCYIILSLNLDKYELYIQMQEIISIDVIHIKLYIRAAGSFSGARGKFVTGVPIPNFSGKNFADKNIHTYIHT